MHGQMTRDTNITRTPLSNADCFKKVLQGLWDKVFSGDGLGSLSIFRALISAIRGETGSWPKVSADLAVFVQPVPFLSTKIHTHHTHTWFAWGYCSWMLHVDICVSHFRHHPHSYHDLTQQMPPVTDVMSLIFTSSQQVCDWGLMLYQFTVHTCFTN